MKNVREKRRNHKGEETAEDNGGKIKRKEKKKGRRE
jgi:hypothetical protein